MLPRIAHIAQRVSEIERLLGRVTDTSPTSSDGAFAQALQRGYALTLAGTQSTPAKLRATFGDGQLDDLVSQISAKYGVDADLVHAVIKVESDYDANCVSSAGASGLMQLMPSTARHLGVENIFDPADNIDGGVRYLKQQMDRFGSVELALAAYNAGPGAVAQHKGIPPYRETQAYVPRVLQYYNSRVSARTQSAQPSWTPTSLGSSTTTPGGAGAARPRAAAPSITPQMLAMAPGNGAGVTAEAVATAPTTASTDNLAPLFARSQRATPAPETILDTQAAMTQTPAERQAATSQPVGNLQAASETGIGVRAETVARHAVNAAVEDGAQSSVAPAAATSSAASAAADAQHEALTTRPPVRGVLLQANTTTQNTIARQIDQALRADMNTETLSVGDPRPAQTSAPVSVAEAGPSVAPERASTATGNIARALPLTPAAEGTIAIARQPLAGAAAPIADVPAAVAPVDGAPAQTTDVRAAGRSVWQSLPTPTVQIADAGLQAQVLVQAAIDQAAVSPSAAVVETDPAQIVLRALDDLSVPVMQTVTNANVRRPGPQNSAGRGASTSTPMAATAQLNTQAPPAVLENVAGPVATMTTTVAPDQLRVTGTVADDMAPLTNDAVLPKPSLAAAPQSGFAEQSFSVANDIDVASGPEAPGGQGSSGALTESIASQVAGTVSGKIADLAASRQVATGGTQTADSGSEVTVQRSTQGAPTTGAAGGTDVQESVTIELSPPELGRVRIAFELRGSEARVNVNAEYAATASHLDQGFRALQSQLEDMGIRLTHLAVSCDASSDFQQGPGQHGQAGHDQPSPASPWPIVWHESETGDSESADPGAQQSRQAARVTPDSDSLESTGRAAVIDLMG